MLKSCFCVLLMSLAACAPPIEKRLVSKPLPVADFPNYRPGDTWTWQLPSGTQLIDRITDVADDGTLTAESSVTKGCIVTLNREIYGPASRLSNCSGTSYTQTMTQQGNLFPLRVGNRASWSVLRTSQSGDVDQYDDTCEVIDTANVTVPAGTYDTFVIRCENQTRQREYYFAPEIGSAVIYRRTSQSSGIRTELLVSFQRS